jgi:hypothetical protein
LIALIRSLEIQVSDWNLAPGSLGQADHTAYIHRLTVTPSGIYLYGPELENQNRVLRKYRDHHDFFVRVQFCDEDGESLRFNPQISNDKIYYERFRQVLNNGISIAGRRFAFLGFSHSSLRAQSCWFMAPFVHDGGLLFDRELIKGLGDFSEIRCPAKCAARIGQAFSETPTAVTLGAGVVYKMEDVTRNGRVFSDGVGTISREVLKQVWAALPSAKRTKPTLFQIRYSGEYPKYSYRSRILSWASKDNKNCKRGS